MVVQLADLPVGDYVLGPGLAVERKGPADLGASIRDGRLFDQAERLQSVFPQAVLLLEGRPQRRKSGDERVAGLGLPFIRLQVVSGGRT